MTAAACRRLATDLWCQTPTLHALGGAGMPLVLRTHAHSAALLLRLATRAGPLAQQPWSVLQAWVLLVAPIVPASKRDAESPGTPLLLLSR